MVKSKAKYYFNITTKDLCLCFFVCHLLRIPHQKHSCQQVPITFNYSQTENSRKFQIYANSQKTKHFWVVLFVFGSKELRKEIDAGLKHKQRGTYYSQIVLITHYVHFDGQAHICFYAGGVHCSSDNVKYNLIHRFECIMGRQQSKIWREVQSIALQKCKPN